MSGIDSGERLLIYGDLNGHVGSEIDGFEGVHGGFGFGKQKVEGEMILETADALNLAVLRRRRRVWSHMRMANARLWLIIFCPEKVKGKWSRMLR